MKTYAVDEQTMHEILEYIEYAEIALMVTYGPSMSLEEMIESGSMPDIWKKLKSMQDEHK